MAIPKIKNISSNQYDTNFWSPAEWQAFGASGGTVDSAGNLVAGGQRPVMENGAQGSTFMGAGQGQVLGTLEGGPNSTSWSGNDIATGVNAATGLASALLGHKNYKLAKDTLSFNKAATNRDVANQGLAYNSALDMQTSNASALGGLSSAESQARLDANKAKYMNTSAIG